MSAVDTEKKTGDTETTVSGELLFCGTTKWDAIGRKPISQDENVLSPTRIRSLMDIDIRFVAAGCTSCHCVALDVQGRCYTWGRNEKGQLGHGDLLQRNIPTVVSKLSKYKVVRAGSGRSHTVVVTEDGKSFGFGWNKHGQLGTGSAKNEVELSPVACLVPEATNVACGGEFTVWLSSVEGSSILTAGLPQYGQLGHGTDNEYNTKESSVKLAYEAQPRPKAISALSEKTIVKVACGTNHTVAVDSSGSVYTWGFGGYGRLGHREQKDEWTPRQVEVFQRNNLLPPNAVVSAGSVNSACTAAGGQLYMWGKLKTNGDNWMYPKPLMDLSGWNIRCMDSGNSHHAVGADDSCISWGLAHHGELGYGPTGPKSSANPKKIDTLNNTHVMSVACGQCFTLIVVDRTNAADKLAQLEVYEGSDDVEVVEEPNGSAAKKNKSNKKVAAGAAKSSSNSKKRKQQKEPSESESEQEKSAEENEDGSDEDDDEEVKTKSKRGKATSKGRGRGRPPKSQQKPSAQKSSGRGRGKARKAK